VNAINWRLVLKGAAELHFEAFRALPIVWRLNELVHSDKVPKANVRDLSLKLKATTKEILKSFAQKVSKMVEDNRVCFEADVISADYFSQALVLDFVELVGKLLMSGIPDEWLNEMFNDLMVVQRTLMDLVWPNAVVESTRFSSYSEVKRRG